MERHSQVNTIELIGEWGNPPHHKVIKTRPKPQTKYLLRECPDCGKPKLRYKQRYCDDCKAIRRKATKRANYYKKKFG